MVDLVVGGAVLWLAGLVYLAPSFVASRRHPLRLPHVLMLNALTGWTVIGWLWALRAATCRQHPPRPAVSRDELAWQALPYETDVFRPRVSS